MASALAASMLSGVKSGIKAHPKAGGGSGVFSRSRNLILRSIRIFGTFASVKSSFLSTQTSRAFPAIPSDPGHRNPTCIGEVVVLVHTDQQSIPGDSFGSGPPESDLPVPEAAFLVTDQQVTLPDIDALDHVASDALIKCVKLVFDLDFFDLLV